MGARSSRLVSGLLATPAGARVRALRRALEPAHVTRDRRDVEHLRAILAATLDPASNCVDVGAHEGSVLADIVRLAPRGRHLAVEPLPALAQRLRERFPAVDVRALALSDHHGREPFVHVVDRPGWSGFRERPTPGNGRVEHVTVAVAPLDDLVGPDADIAFMKIDVEGAEEQVLAGAMTTIARCRPRIAFEHGLGSADHYFTEPRTIHRMLGDAGLRVFDLDGNGPYAAAAFERAVARGERVNFLARA
jgi:FkbM family methyltransferase